MLDEFVLGLRIMAMAPLCGLIFHGAAYISSFRKARALAQSEGKPRLDIMPRFLPRQRIFAIYFLCLAATGLLAALESHFFRLRLIFGVLFLLAALLALRFEHKAKVRIGEMT